MCLSPGALTAPSFHQGNKLQFARLLNEPLRTFPVRSRALSLQRAKCIQFSLSAWSPEGRRFTREGLTALPASALSRALTHANAHTMPSPRYQSQPAQRRKRTSRSGTRATISSLARASDSLPGSQTPLSECPRNNEPRNPQR